jgi:lysophospholipase L1-like esterase
MHCNRRDRWLIAIVVAVWSLVTIVPLVLTASPAAAQGVRMLPYGHAAGERLAQLGGAATPAADQPAPRTDANSQLAHEQLLEKARKGGIDVYFEGDSITRRWGTSDEQYKAFLENWRQNFFGWNAANFGWGGDTTQNILWRLQNGELDNLHPKIIVLMAGTNNVGKLPPQANDDPRVAEISRGIKAILDLCRQKAPKATIVLMGITPRNDNLAVMPIINQINERIAKYADGKKLRYLNINDRLADQDGKLFEGMAIDGLHLDVKGYQVWADALKPIFREVLGPPAKVDQAPPPTGDPSARKLPAPQSRAPYLRRQGSATQLMVDDKPFLVLAGELGNSTASSLDYMRPVWAKLASLNLNTVLVPIYWELIEPAEGKFDFALVDGLLQEARKHRLRIVPLWFGSWKNSMSCYAPGWVKTDQRRFPRSQDKAGKGLEILSPFSKENLDADARAFAAFMRHLREVDGNDHTVIMVQVENEVGMIPDSRDRSAIADRLFSQPVPAELMNHLQQQRESLMAEFRSVWAANGFKSRGTWEEVFGKGLGTDEIFMAWHFARYVNRITELGKAEYPLPMFVNAALIRPGYQPGQYPSAGPLPHIMDVWRAGAPKIDFLSPDIYFPNFAEWVRRYHRPGNPLFVPEVMPYPLNAVNALYAIGQHEAIGFSPFSIESMDEGSNKSLTDSYDLLRQLSPLLLESQGKGLTAGLLPEGPEQRLPQQLRLGGYTLNITYERPPAPPAGQNVQPPTVLSGGLVIATGADEFVFAGTAITVTFEVDQPADQLVGILSVQEGRYEKGQWIPGRWLNGDQTHQGRNLRLVAGRFTIQRIKLYRYR